MYDDLLVDRNIRLSTSIFILVEALKEIESASSLKMAQDFATDALGLYNKIKGMHNGSQEK